MACKIEHARLAPERTKKNPESALIRFAKNRFSRREIPRARCYTTRTRFSCSFPPILSIEFFISRIFSARDLHRPPLHKQPIEKGCLHRKPHLSPRAALRVRREYVPRKIRAYNDTLRVKRGERYLRESCEGKTYDGILKISSELAHVRVSTSSATVATDRRGVIFISRNISSIYLERGRI